MSLNFNKSSTTPFWVTTQMFGNHSFRDFDYAAALMRVCGFILKKKMHIERQCTYAKHHHVSSCSCPALEQILTCIVLGNRGLEISNQGKQ